MKATLIILCAAFAVSQAAFTSSLIRDAQPKVADAMLQVRQASRVTGVLGELTTAVETHVSTLLNELQSLLATGQNFAEGLYNHIASLINGQTGTGRAFNKNQVDDRAIISSLLAAAAAGAASAAGASLWNWLFGKSFANLSSLADLNIADVLSALATQAASYINQLDLGNLFQAALETVLPKPLSDLLATRGVFDDIWTSMSASPVWQAASQSFAELQQFVTDHALTAWNNAATLIQQAAALLQANQQNIGAAYNQLAAQLQQLTGKQIS